MKNKKAQLAIWVIIAIVFVVIIAILFVLNKSPVAVKQEEQNIQGMIEKCVRDSVDEAVDKMLPQGGFIVPENYKVYKNIEVSYLCQNVGYYKPCINQHPLLLNEENKQIKGYIEPRIEQCFSDAKAELEKKSYQVSIEPMNLSVSLASQKVYVFIDRKVTLNKNSQAQLFSEFNVEINNPIHDLSQVAIEIASQEAKFCYFEYVGYMLLYPKFDIKKFTFSDSTKIYTIKDKKSQKEMNIAVRGCAIPPGI